MSTFIKLVCILLFQVLNSWKFAIKQLESSEIGINHEKQLKISVQIWWDSNGCKLYMVQGWWDDSIGKGAGHQSWQPGFDPWDVHEGEQETIL